MLQMSKNCLKVDYYRYLAKILFYNVTFYVSLDRLYHIISQLYSVFIFCVSHITNGKPKIILQLTMHGRTSMNYIKANL